MRTLALILCLGMTSGPALAYEEDVHYGLTLWLARMAGFPADEAEIIAQGNVNLDHSALSAVHLVTHYACLSRDVEASRLVRDFHFPSDAELPGRPADRVVQPRSSEALMKSEERIVLPRRSIPENLRQFGAGLHALQDSWSHQGVPGSPWPVLCDVNLSWGHPDARGGWREHLADLTHAQPENETVAMGLATFAQLCSYRERRQLQPACALANGDLEPHLLQFAVAATKSAKSEWFRQREFTDTRFIDLINLPPGGAYGNAELNPKVLVPGRRASPAGREAAASAQPAEQSLLAFVRDAVTAPAERVVYVVKQWIDFASFRIGLFAPETDQRPETELIEMQLHFWRHRDHGAVLALTKGEHVLARVPADTLREIRAALRAGSQPYPSLDDALLALDDTGRPLRVHEFAGKDGVALWIGTLRLRHTPSESLLIAGRMVNGRMRIVAIDSIVEH